ncbi:MAG TPA: tetratricopeptide repeat protein [Acidobacteriota bacterium]|jgi:predicted ATPase|nr:tetratricopeptide repeat protein [Acidobacteriota bacterium]
MIFNVGSHLGLYEILSPLGAGGMGEVYRAMDTRLRREVAIKLLPKALVHDPELQGRFGREARLLAALNHPNIAAIYGLDESDGMHFLILELVPGQTLDARLSAGPLAIGESLALAKQIAEALQAAHAKGIIHCDLKPANLKITPDTKVKVLDFGVARVLQLDECRSLGSGNTTTVSIVGTPAYMSPEQVRGQPVDERTDIWSFGCVLYEMLTGRKVFCGKTISDTFAAILGADPDWNILPAKTPVKIRDLLHRCIEKDLTCRLRNIGDVRVEIEEALTAFSARPAVQAPALTEPAPPQTRERPAHSLPMQPTSFIGRQKELAAAKKLLRAKEIRLLTLTGPGGTGKTRLSLQLVAELVEEFEDGVCFISLAAIRDPSLVISTLSQTFQIKESAESSLMDRLKAYLQDKQMLLLLDNFEQVIAGGPQISELLAACPRLKVLSTSRARLRLRGEHEFSVPPLTLPDRKHLPSAKDLARFPAVALFIERAAAVKREFRITEENGPAVVEICAQLDGLPLAIELAAARVKALPPHALLARLQNRLKLLTGGAQDLPARQQTMRAAIDWSYDLLDENEKKLFRRLSIFVGGFTLEAAEAVVTAGHTKIQEEDSAITENRSPAPPEINVLEGISSLLDKNLLRQEGASDNEPRFQIIGTIREYAMEHLEAASEAATVRRSHANFFLGFAERAEQELLGANQATWLGWLEQEHDNLRAALDWVTESKELEMGLRLGEALWRFWEMRGYLAEGRERLEALLALPQSSTLSKTRMKVLYAAGILADAQNDYQSARSHFGELLAINRELGNKWGIANSLNNLGIVALRQQDYAAARLLYNESLAEWRKLDNNLAIALSLNNLGKVANILGDYAEARSLHQESLQIFQELQDRRGIAWSLNHLGDVARGEREIAEARSMYEESLALFRQLDDKRGIASSLADLGSLARDAGDNSAARSLYEESLVLYKQLGDRRGIAHLLEGFAGLAAAKRQATRALRLSSAAAMVRRAVGATLSASEEAALQHKLEKIRQGLSNSASTAAWNEGANMSLERAIEYALER